MIANLFWRAREFVILVLLLIASLVLGLALMWSTDWDDEL